MVRHLIVTKSAAFYLVEEYKTEKIYTTAQNCHMISRSIWGTKHYAKCSIRNIHISRIIKNVTFTKDTTYEEVYDALKKQGSICDTVMRKVEGTK